GAAPRETCAKHADAGQLAFGRERADHAGARRSVSAEVALLIVVLHDHLVALDRDGHRLLDLPHHRMTPFDTAVEDADPHPGAGRSAPGPVARDLPGPLLGQRDPF